MRTNKRSVRCCPVLFFGREGVMKTTSRLAATALAAWIGLLPRTATAQVTPDGTASGTEAQQYSGPSLIDVPAVALNPKDLPKLRGEDLPTGEVPIGYLDDFDALKKLAENVPIEPGSAQEDPAGNDVVVPLAPSFSTDFGSMNNSGVPPDPNIAVGLDHVITIINFALRVQDKLGDQLLQSSLNSWFSNVVPANTFIFDPKVTYDSGSDRFIIVAMGRICVFADCRVDPNNRSWWLISASQTSSATGNWWNWALNARLDGSGNTDNWADYPGVGLDNLAAYLTANMFRFGGGFQYSKLRILNKSVLYTGGSLGWWDFWGMCNPGGFPSVCFPVPVFGCGIGSGSAFTIQPAHTFGAPGVEYLFNARGNDNQLTRWTLTNPLGTPPSLNCSALSVAAYSQAPNARQPGGATRLNTGDTRLLNAVYRNGRLWTTHTIAVNFGSGNECGIRWYELNPGAPSVVQQESFGLTGFDYYYPALMPDRFGNMVIVFARSGNSEFAGIRFTGRLSTDPPSTLQGSDLLQAGTATYVQLDMLGRNRWGDYLGIAWDPDTFLGDFIWIYSEYAGVFGANTYGTWVGSVTYSFPTGP